MWQLVIDAGTRDVLNTIVQNPNSFQVSTFYASCMDTASIESLGASPLTELLTHVPQSGLEESIALMNWFGMRHLLEWRRLIHRSSHHLGIPGFWSIGSTIDSMNPSMNIAGVRTILSPIIRP